MAYRRTHTDRITSALAVAAIHALFGYALVTGLKLAPAPTGTVPALKVFDVPEPPPPPPQPPEPPTPAEAPDEAAAPILKAEASAIVAPEPIVRPPDPPPILAAETPGTGSETSQGAADQAGPGTGAGGIAIGSRRIAGDITDADYPEAAARARVEGVVQVSYTVLPNGRATRCFSTRSSGSAELDTATCRLIVQRFRFEPARDAAGKPVPEARYWEQTWWLERRNRHGSRP